MKELKFVILLIITFSIILLSKSCSVFKNVIPKTTISIDTTYAPDTIYYQIPEEYKEIEGKIFGTFDSVYYDTTKNVYIDTLWMYEPYYDTLAFNAKLIQYENALKESMYTRKEVTAEINKALQNKYLENLTNIKSDTVTVSSDYSTAISYIADNTLKLELYQKGTDLVIIIDSLRTYISKNTVTINEKSNALKKATKKSKRYAILFYGLLLTVVIIIIAINVVSKITNRRSRYT